MNSTDWTNVPEVATRIADPALYGSSISTSSLTMQREVSLAPLLALRARKCEEVLVDATQHVDRASYHPP